MSFIKSAMNRTRIFIFSLFLLTTLGFFTYQNMPKESFPDVSIPMMITTVNYTGISPEDGERLIAKPLEKEFKTISGLKEMDTKGRRPYLFGAHNETN